MKIEIEIPDKRIDDYIRRARFEWARFPEYDAELGVLTLTEVGDGEVNIPHVVNRADIARGIAKLAEERYVHTLGELLADAGDMYTGALMVQFAIFGEEKYG